MDKMLLPPPSQASNRGSVDHVGYYSSLAISGQSPTANQAPDFPNESQNKLLKPHLLKK